MNKKQKERRKSRMRKHRQKSRYAIRVTFDGQETKAELIRMRKEGLELVKVAAAKCREDDEFELRVGAKIAIDRLFGCEPEKGVTNPVMPTKYKGGELVRIRGNSGTRFAPEQVVQIVRAVPGGYIVAGREQGEYRLSIIEGYVEEEKIVNA